MWLDHKYDSMANIQVGLPSNSVFLPKVTVTGQQLLSQFHALDLNSICICGFVMHHIATTKNTSEFIFVVRFILYIDTCHKTWIFRWFFIFVGTLNLQHHSKIGMTFLGDKWHGLFEGQMVWPFGGGGTNYMAFLREKRHVLFKGQMTLPFWGTNDMTFLRDRWHVIFEGQMTLPFWGTNDMTFLRDK